MTKHFLLCFFLAFSFTSQQQLKEPIQRYISDKLSYQHIQYNTRKNKSYISIHQINFKDCTMSYSVFIKTGDKTERFRVRILLSRINEIKMAKSKEGFYAITFTTDGKSILKEYPNDALIHQKKQSIPLKKYDAKALEYFKNLKAICTKKST